MLLTLAAILIDRLVLRRTPEQRGKAAIRNGNAAMRDLLAAVDRANAIAAERIAVERELTAARVENVRLVREGGPDLTKGLAAIINGDIGGKTALGLQTPRDTDNPGGTSRGT